MLGGGEGPAGGSCGPWGARRARPAGLETCAGPAVPGLNRAMSSAVLRGMASSESFISLKIRAL